MSNYRDCSDNVGLYFNECSRKIPYQKPPDGAVALAQIGVKPGDLKNSHQLKPFTNYCHYSNKESQGSVQFESKDWRPWYFKDKEEHHVAYSDRLYMWDDNGDIPRLCEEFGVKGDQGWHSSLPALGEERLFEFMQRIFKLSKKPKMARIIHCYNVSNGYSCPVLECITDK